MANNNAGFAFRRSEHQQQALHQAERRAVLLGTSAESLRRYKRLFHVFDQDGDGVIDHAELTNMLNALGIPASPEDVTEMIESNDTNLSGDVQLDEFLEIMTAYGLGGAEGWQAGAVVEDTHSHDFMKKSSEALQHVRVALETPHFRPDSALRCAMDLGVVLTCIYWYSFLLLYDVGKVHWEEWTDDGFLWLELGLTAFLFADILVTCNTAVMVRGAVVTSRVGLIKQYARGWLAVDVAAAFPADLIAYFAGAPRVTVTVLRHVRLLKVFKLSKMFPVQNPGVMSPTYVNVHFSWLPAFRVCIQLLLLVHTLAVIWIALHDEDYDYVTALYWVTYTLTTVGYGDVDVAGRVQRAYACLLFLFGVVFNGLIVGYLTMAVMQSDIKGDVLDKMRQTLAVLQHFDVPVPLQEEILSYQYHVLENNLSASYTDLIAGLPVPMQDQVGVFIRIRYIAQVPMFNKCETVIKVALAQSLKSVVVPPDEYIIVAGEEGHEMFFLSHGFCDVSSADGRWMATIPKGGFFGEVALLVQMLRASNVVAITFCDLFVLRKEEFDTILESFPSFAVHIQSEIRTRQRRRAAAPGATVPCESVLMSQPGYFRGSDAAPDELVLSGSDADCETPTARAQRRSLEAVAVIASLRHSARQKREKRQSQRPPSRSNTPDRELHSGTAEREHEGAGNGAEHAEGADGETRRTSLRGLATVLHTLDIAKQKAQGHAQSRKHLRALLSRGDMGKGAARRASCSSSKANEEDSPVVHPTPNPLGCQRAASRAVIRTGAGIDRGRRLSPPVLASLADSQSAQQPLRWFDREDFSGGRGPTHTGSLRRPPSGAGGPATASAILQAVQEVREAQRGTAASTEQMLRSIQSQLEMICHRLPTPAARGSSTTVGEDPFRCSPAATPLPAGTRGSVPSHPLPPPGVPALHVASPLDETPLAARVGALQSDMTELLSTIRELTSCGGSAASINMSASIQGPQGGNQGGQLNRLDQLLRTQELRGGNAGSGPRSSLFAGGSPLVPNAGPTVTPASPMSRHGSTSAPGQRDSGPESARRVQLSCVPPLSMPELGSRQRSEKVE
eukprot:TRINITY_DN24506_c0_g1_i1.p1 TRINITY_DN24506_c0_g1~~TRINITY_DN24506_c0_g1_i1.p1  ORF type:complete len:1103 (+),score=308.66 TRINITY_DN24506_c0_g1_i1:95-3310(+)